MFFLLILVIHERIIEVTGVTLIRSVVSSNSINEQTVYCNPNRHFTEYNFQGTLKTD